MTLPQTFMKRVQKLSLGLAVLFASTAASFAGTPPTHFVWLVGDDVAHNGDQDVYCFQFNPLGHVMNLGNPVSESFCSTPKPIYYKWLVGDQVAHNGDQTVYCFEMNREYNRATHSGNPVSNEFCGGSPESQTTFSWHIGDEIAHNGDQTVYCFQFNPLGNVMNLGNPVSESFCNTPKPVYYEWLVGDQVAHNGDQTVYCFEVNYRQGVMNAGNPVDNAFCR